MSGFNNLKKLFRYVNENGDSITFDMGNGFLINKPVGIDTLSISLAQAQGINQVGATIQSTNIQPRPVTVSGYIFGDNQQSKKDRLMAVIRPDLTGKLYADDYYLEVRPTATPTIEAKKKAAQFQFSLLAPYPYWCKDDSASATLSGVAKRFKFPWNISRSYRYGEVISAQFININNNGQVPIPFTVTFSAVGNSVVNPKLIDAKTNKFLLLNKTLVPNEKVTVEITHERTYVNSTVDGECRGALDLASSFTRLAVGDNVIKPDADSGKSALQVDVQYATEIVGVTL